ncbi:hypothetical protein F4680DRAFT_450277 [Xylaria scruposa]|nr:hypothetical protein F4680DRAFT_450277 [Xylaria scruposa]
MTQPQSPRDQMCIILSALFLDRHISLEEISSMGAQLHRLGASPQILDDVVYHDLFPILNENLTAIAGVWTAFDERWLLSRIHYRRNTQQRHVVVFLNYLLRVLLGGCISDDLRLLKRALEEAGNAPKEENA